MAIVKINQNLPLTEKLRLLNEQTVELNGLNAKARFDVNEISQLIIDISADRKFLRDQKLGNTYATYTNWSHLKAESGYSIWKLTPTNYTYNALNALYLDNKVLTNKGQALTESATIFDKVFVFDDSLPGNWVDNTTEAGTEIGTEFTILEATADYLYVGLATTFGGVKFELQTRGSGLTLDYEYWDGSIWTNLNFSGNTVTDNTSNLESDGNIEFTIPGDWATTAVNGQTKYWIRLATTSIPVTIPKTYFIVPANSAVTLLALSSDQVINEEWAWCSFSGSIYVTIRNTGATAHEGDFYIASGSTALNLQNYFIVNHTISADYEDSTYTGAVSSGVDIGDSIGSGTLGSVLFLGAAGVLAQDNTNFFWDNTNKRLGIGTSTPLHELHVVGSMELVHTAAANDEYALEIDLDAAGFGDIKAIDIVYTTGAVSAGEDEEAILVNLDKSLSTGGSIAAFEVLSTTGSATVYGLEVGATINPIIQFSGTFGDMDYARYTTSGGGEVDCLTAFTSTGTDVTMFTANADYIIVGDVATFEEIEFLLDTVASNPGIKPDFFFSTGGSGFTEFSPTDGTNGFRNNGIIIWLLGDISGTWATNASGNYEIKIVRTHGGSITSPIEDLVQISSVIEYIWDLTGNLTVNTVAVTDEVYGVGWNSALTVPTKNAVYDKIETLQDQDAFLDDIAALTDPDDDRLLYWKDSSGGSITWLNLTSDFVIDYTIQASPILKQIHNKSITIESPTTSEDAGQFFIDQAITITKVVISIVGSATPSVTIDIHHHTDRSNAGNALITSPTASTEAANNAESTGHIITTFDDATILANSFLWVEVDAESGTVTNVNITIYYTHDS